MVIILKKEKLVTIKSKLFKILGTGNIALVLETMSYILNIIFVYIFIKNLWKIIKNLRTSKEVVYSRIYLMYLNVDSI